MAVRIQEASFDPGIEIAGLHAANPRVGAVATFIGYARDFGDQRQVSCLFLEHYPPMTERALQRIVDEAAERWAVIDVAVVHRVGEILPTEPIVFVGVSSEHRANAFAACQFVIDFLKVEAPFWKKETTPAGTYWVEAKAGDEQAAASWTQAALQPVSKA